MVDSQWLTAILKSSHAMYLPSCKKAAQVDVLPTEWLVRRQHLENSGEVAHVEEVVELGRSREHLGLHCAPQADGHLGQVPDHLRRRDSANILNSELGSCAELTGIEKSEHMTGSLLVRHYLRNIFERYSEFQSGKD